MLRAEMQHNKNFKHPAEHFVEFIKMRSYVKTLGGTKLPNLVGSVGRGG